LNTPPGKRSIVPGEEVPVVVNDARRKDVQAAVDAADVPNQLEPLDQVVGAVQILAFISNNWNGRRGCGKKDERGRRCGEGETP
jgi:hypothetical protein